MFKHLVVLALFVAAVLLVSTPAHASTLYADVNCSSDYPGLYNCDASVHGGTGTYTSHLWAVQLWNQSPQYYNTSTQPGIGGSCTRAGMYTVTLTVTDSAGATASNSTTFRCMRALDEDGEG